MKKPCMARVSVCTLLVGLLAACATTGMWRTQISDVYVEDFHSDDMQSCRPSDVPLNHARARDFFRRARQVDSKVLHDHYNIAPCWIEGTLKYGANVCEWNILAGATGVVKCDGKTQYFVCDDCEDLFREP